MSQQLAPPAASLDPPVDDSTDVDSEEAARQRELRREKVLRRREELSRSAAAADPSSGLSASPAAPAAPAAELNQAVPMTAPSTSTTPISTPVPSVFREDMVKSAVDFLAHPRVVSSDPEKKRKFLKTKGLSDEEIVEAFRRANSLTAAVPQQQQTQQHYGAAVVPQQQVNGRAVAGGQRYGPPVPPPPMMAPPIQQIVHQSPSLRALVFIVVVCSGIGAGLVYFIRRYVIQYFWPKQSSSDRLAEIQKQLVTVQEAVISQVAEVKEALSLIRSFLENQIDSVVEKQRLDEMRQRQESARVSELKREINAIQNLLPVTSFSLKRTQSFDSPLLEDAENLTASLKGIKSVVQTQRKETTGSSSVVDLASSGQLTRAPSTPLTSSSTSTPPPANTAGGPRRLPSWMQSSPAIPEWQRNPSTPTTADDTAAATTSSSTQPAITSPTPVVAEQPNGAAVEASHGNGNAAAEAAETENGKPEKFDHPYSSSFLDVVKMVQAGQTPPNVRTDIDDAPENPNADVPKGIMPSMPKPWESAETTEVSET